MAAEKKHRPSLHLFRFAEDFQAFWAGQPVFETGQPGDVMYVVKEGEVDLLVNDKVVETVGPAGILGEMALIDKMNRSATAIAKTDCKLVAIDEQRFQFLVQQTPYFAIEVLRIMARRLREMDKKH